MQELDVQLKIEDNKGKAFIGDYYEPEAEMTFSIAGPKLIIIDHTDVAEKFRVFGWEVLEIENGNDLQQVIDGLNEAKNRTGKGKPVCVIMTTMMGNGVDFMMHTHAWHGKAPNDEQLENALSQNPETLGDY